MERPEICVVGAFNLDLISYVPRLPRMGETLHGTRFHMGFGKQREKILGYVF